MKKKGSFLLGATLLFGMMGTAIPVSAESATTTEGIKQEASAAVNLLPLRKVFEDIGAVVEWDEETRTANIEWEQADLNVIVDTVEKTALFGGKQHFFEEGEYLVKGGRVMVSSAFLESVLGGTVVEQSGVYSLVKAETNS